MHQIHTLKNGLTLITVNIPSIESVTSMVAVKAGSRYENKNIKGLSHFLEHMFFKGSKKYPSPEIIATIIDSLGAITNASTSREYTYYWIKSASNHLEIASDILSSMLIEPILSAEEIDKEKGVIIEEMRMYRDTPSQYVWDLYENLQFGDQPLGWDIIGEEKTVLNFNRDNVLDYLNSLYSPENMVLIYVGKLPKNIQKIAEKYFSKLPKRGKKDFKKYQKFTQKTPKLKIHYRQTDQANLVLGFEGIDRHSPKKYALRLLSLILGAGMSSRLFLEIREKRGLAYHISTIAETYQDSGLFAVYAGLKLEKLEESIKVILSQLNKIAAKKVGDNELKKAKEMEKGRVALRSESTDFLATYFGLKFLLDKKVETFDDYLKKIDSVTATDILQIARQIFNPKKINLQLIAPIKDKGNLFKALNS